METKPLAILAAGGTGGHMFPAQALAEELLVRGWEVKLSTDLRGARFTQNFPKAVKIETVSSATLAKHGLISKIKAPFLILGGILATLKTFLKRRLLIIVGFGGYPTIPALSASILVSLPRIIHEQNGILGRVNQLFAKKVHLVACGTWPTILPENITSEHIGNPVRKEILNINLKKDESTSFFNLKQSKKTVLILGGSLGASRINEFIRRFKRDGCGFPESK